MSAEDPSLDDTALARKIAVRFKGVQAAHIATLRKNYGEMRRAGKLNIEDHRAGEILRLAKSRAEAIERMKREYAEQLSESEQVVRAMGLSLDSNPGEIDDLRLKRQDLEIIATGSPEHALNQILKEGITDPDEIRARAVAAGKEYQALTRKIDALAAVFAHRRALRGLSD